MRACFKNRPVRGPGLQWGQNRPVPCRPRALTRRFRGFLKHALKRMRTETRRGIDRLIPPLNPRAGHEWLLRAARRILVAWLVAGPGAIWVAHPQPRSTLPNAAGHW